MESGNIWIYPPEVPQKYLTRSKDGTAYSYLHFTGSDIEKILDTLGIKVCVPIKSKNNSLIMKAFDSIRAAMCDTGALSKLTAEYQSLFLISLIAKNQKRTINSGIMKRVTDDMEHSFAEKYSAVRYAKMLGLSESRFNHLFREHIGMSPYAYILRLRINNAAVLLSETDIRIKNIAVQCGFDDPLYFTQAFKRIKGLTPSQYRKANLFK